MKRIAVLCILGSLVAFLNGCAKASDTPDALTLVRPSGDCRDQSVQIMEKLEKYGECRLMAGNYYISGIGMPENAVISGAGESTVLILMDSVTSGAVLECSGGNTIENLQLQGGMTARPNVDSFDSTRYGIRIAEASAPVKISKLTAEGFSGAGVYVHNTGYSLLNSIMLSDSLFRFNRAGLEMGKYGEYAATTGCSFVSNYYGVINHGGNNKYVACGFDGNEYGFFSKNGYGADSDELIYPNNGHGSCVGCSFNHNINAIYLEYITYGFVFSGCQCFDGAVSIRSSCGVSFSGCQFGKIPMHFTYGGMHHISNCVFMSAPSIAAENYANSTREVVQIRDCFTVFGERIELSK